MSQSSIASSKRPHTGDSHNERPKKVMKITLESPPSHTGLEETGILSEVTPKVPTTPKTLKDQERYERRRMSALHCNRIKAKREKARKVSPAWNKMSASSQRGLQNLTGNLCYRNSLFQSLLHCPKFSNFLLKFHPDSDSNACIYRAASGSCVACEMRNLVQAYWSIDRDNVTKSLQSIHSTFKKCKWAFSGQADPDEQFTWMSRMFSEQIPIQAFSYFEAINQIVLNSSIKCNACGYKSSQIGDQEGSLSVELMPRIRNGSLSQYLDQHLTSTVEDYRCEKCDNKSDKTRIRLISFSPDLLLVSLKRFDPLGRKDKSPILITPTLDLNKYRSASNTRSSVYHLSAIVSHSGSTLNGHYVCTAKGPDGKWLLFNDDLVSKSCFSEALKPGNSFTPYLLFFQRNQK